MSQLTSGRTEPPCKTVGGVKRVFLFNYVDYLYTQIVGTRGVELTSFPSTDIYEFSVVGASFNESIKNDDNGVSYTQSLSFTLKKQDRVTTYDLSKMAEMQFRYIVEFNNGKYKIGGLYNSARLEFENTTGGSKPDLNGYKITMQGEEEYQAAFIENLSSTGFNIIDVLLLEDYEPLLMDDESQIILE